MRKDPVQPGLPVRLQVLGLAIAVFVACKGVSTPAEPRRPAGPSRPLNQTLYTADITFHFAQGDTMNAAYQQAFHEWAVPHLGISMPRRLRYFKYFNIAHMREITGMPYDSWAEVENYAIHSIEPQQGHEAIHVYSYVIGWPSDFFTEGIACALDINPYTGEEVLLFGTPLHTLCRAWLVEGTLYPLRNIVGNQGFGSRVLEQCYSQAGSFTKFIIAEFGLEPLKEIFRTVGDYDSTSDILAKFESAYGIPLEEAERRWHDFLRRW